MTEKLDLRGLTCPEPVIRTKKLLDNPETPEVEALVDDDVCVANLERLARSLKAQIEVHAHSDHFQVNIKRGGGAIAGSHSDREPRGQSQTEKMTVVFLAKDTLGQGDPEFSQALLNVFLQTLLESGHRPRAIILSNSGVKLAVPDSKTAKVLNDFKDAGVEVLACGLCVEYYGLKGEIAKEQITNMFAICEYLTAADRIIAP